jgi:hypothetical protein
VFKVCIHGPQPHDEEHSTNDPTRPGDATPEARTDVRSLLELPCDVIGDTPKPSKGETDRHRCGRRSGIVLRLPQVGLDLGEPRGAHSRRQAPRVDPHPHPNARGNDGNHS